MVSSSALLLLLLLLMLLMLLLLAPVTAVPRVGTGRRVSSTSTPCVHD